MNILITNDDGIDSPGIYALAKEFLDEGEILISAPDRQRSACSHSMTIGQPISVSQIDFHGLNCRAYAVSGTPVDCVKLAYNIFSKRKIDVVISGINNGGNLGTDVLYSGTVSAAIEGTILKIPSFAVSLYNLKMEGDYSSAAYFAKQIYKKLQGASFLNGMVTNINVPPCPMEDVKGISATTLGIMRYNDSYELKKSSSETSYVLSGDLIDLQNDEATDIYAVNNNYVSVTPMHLNLTGFDCLDSLQKLL